MEKIMENGCCLNDRDLAHCVILEVAQILINQLLFRKPIKLMAWSIFIIFLI